MSSAVNATLTDNPLDIEVAISCTCCLVRKFLRNNAGTYETQDSEAGFGPQERPKEETHEKEKGISELRQGIDRAPSVSDVPRSLLSRHKTA